MNEKISQTLKKQPLAAKLFSYRWIVEWCCLLSLVFLVGSVLNCLFQWFAYGQTWDLSAAIYSLVLGVVVYFTSIYQGKVTSLQIRLTIALGALAVWAVFLPMIMKAAGFNLV